MQRRMGPALSNALEVFDQQFKALDLLLRVAERAVAVAAEHTTNVTSGVAVIDLQLTFACLSAGFAAPVCTG